MFCEISPGEDRSLTLALAPRVGPPSGGGRMGARGFLVSKYLLTRARATISLVLSIKYEAIQTIENKQNKVLAYYLDLP